MQGNNEADTQLHVLVESYDSINEKNYRPFSQAIDLDKKNCIASPTLVE